MPGILSLVRPVLIDVMTKDIAKFLKAVPGLVTLVPGVTLAVNAIRLIKMQVTW